jgi:NTP pyrophosphatase (non-canonical NTP hydrolase)
MNRLQQLMVITMEECGELIQECSKVIRKHETCADVGQKHRQTLLEEAGDVYAMIQLMIQHGFFEYYDLEIRAKEKHKKLKKWSNLYDEDEKPSDERQTDLFDLL